MGVLTRVAAVASASAAFVLGIAPAVAVPGPPTAPEYWFAAWHVHRLWHEGVRGQGVTIAEIDTGVNAALPQLSGRVVPGHVFGARGGGNGTSDLDRDPFGHGTAMASIMVARRGPFGVTGLAPGAKIMPLAIPLRGSSDTGHGHVAAAIRYAADHGAQVINMSIGGARHPRRDPVPCPAPEQRAVFHALRAGSVVVAAVGNTGPRANTVEEPGACLGVVAVGAVDESGAVASFSARQPYLALTAPGVRVPSLGRVPGSAYSGRGTSQAAALVSATAALVWSRHPQLTARQVVTRLLATTDDHRARQSPAHGYGTVDAYAAVTAHVPVRSNPVFAAAEPFLRRDAALSRTPATPGESDPPQPLGAVRIGTAPGATASTVFIGVAVAAGVLLLVLVAARLTASRRREPPDGAVDTADDGAQ